MAHADYNCCMICDTKMEYAGESSETKEKPCIDCLANMRDQGVILLTQEEFIAHLESIDDPIAFLGNIGYEKCFYPNALDDYISQRIVVSEDN